MSVLRRTRGAILRITRRRGLSFAIGVAAIAPAVYLNLIETDSPWWMSGLAAILAATGVALAWTGLYGVREDWME